MKCPSKYSNSFQICVECQACKPGLPPRVQELLEVGFDVRDWVKVTQRGDNVEPGRLWLYDQVAGVEA